MKYIIIAFALITTLSLKAQTDNHFFLSEGEVSWVKVYENELSKEKIIAHFENSGLFKLFRIEEERVLATLKPQQIDIDKTGIAGVPEVLRKTDFAGTIVISFKEGKYQVAFSKILLVGYGDYLKKGEKQPFENHYVNKDGKTFRKYFLKKPKRIYDEHFNELFIMEQVKKDDW